MANKTMTIADALAAGFSKCVKDESSHAEDIDDVGLEELEESVYWVLEKESKAYQISADEIKELVSDHVAEQGEVADEDMGLVELVEDIPTETFDAITKIINDKLAERIWWPATDIQLVNDED